MAAQNLVSAPEFPTIRKDVDEVNLTLTVTDGKGRFVQGLTQKNFVILDDRRPPASVNRFQSLTELPLQLCVVIDASDSISNYVKYQQEVAIGFLKRILRPGVDRACLVKFATTPILVQDFTDDIQQLEASVRRTNSEGTTAVWDAVRFTSVLMNRESTGGQVRRAVVLITDGEDNASRATFEEALQAALLAEITVEAVNTGLIEQPQARLHQLAKTTGGDIWRGENPKRLVGALARIEQSLRSGYFVAYQPAGELSPGHFRKIQVKARGLKGKISHRSGYYVPKKREDAALR